MCSTDSLAGKTCSKCNKYRPADRWHQRNKSTCKDCFAEQGAKWRRENPIRAAELSKASTVRNREKNRINSFYRCSSHRLGPHLPKQCKYCDEVFCETGFSLKSYCSSRCKSKEKGKQDRLKWAAKKTHVCTSCKHTKKPSEMKKNGFRCRECINAQWKHRYDNEPEYNLKYRLNAALQNKKPARKIGNRVRTALVNNQKSIKVESMLGFTITELRQHLEGLFTQGMSWDAFCRGEIHIDHKHPVSNYNMDCPIEFRSCWSLNNLRPMWAYDNLSKGSDIECDKIWIDKSDLQGDLWMQ